MSYARELKIPVTKQDGLSNAIQMIINCLEAGDSKEALLQAVDVLDDVRSKANPYLIGKEKARKVKASDNYRGTVNVD